QFIFPKLKRIYTVNDSIAALYEKEYDKKVSVVRNIPDVPQQNDEPDKEKIKKDLGVDPDKKIIILQGAGINIELGAEEAVEAMNYIDEAVLLIIGGGDVMPFLKEIVQQNRLEKKVLFINKMPYQQLINFTKIATVGLTLDKDTNLNYRNSLPNKLFDYIHANVPVLGSPVTEVKKIIEQYKIGTVIENHDPEHIAEKIKYMLADENRIMMWKKNLLLAAEELSWSNEENKLLKVFDGIL
ncbi:MAG: glycosyltransferase, partial [Bacteroidota bacterium]